MANVDYRRPFLGYDFYLPTMEQYQLNELEECMRRS